MAVSAIGTTVCVALACKGRSKTVYVFADLSFFPRSLSNELCETWMFDFLSSASSYEAKHCSNYIEGSGMRRIRKYEHGGLVSELRWGKKV